MYEMKLADIGEGMTEGEIVEILVQKGDTVEVDQPVLEVLTDKVTAELPAPIAGTVVDIVVEKGEVVQVGSTMMKIDSSNAEQRNGKRRNVENKRKDGNGSVIDWQNKRMRRLQNVKAAPYTRKVAREWGVEIEQIQGTGKDGRITVEDVRRFAQLKDERTNGGIAHQSEQEANASAAQMGATQTSHAHSSMSQNDRVIPFQGRRKQIAQKMTHSTLTIPHVTHFDKIDMHTFVSMKEEMKESAQALQSKPSYALGVVGTDQPATSLSLMTVMIKAVAISLQTFPIFNAQLDEEKEEMILHSDIHIGVATHTAEGLIVPVLKHADRLSLQEIQERVKELTQKAQNNELKRGDLQGGTFTMSNVGPVGGMFATPIINHPEVALLSLHQMEEQPVVRNQEIVIRPILNISMSFDHRIADGVTAVQFTNHIKHLLENPLQLFSRLK